MALVKSSDFIELTQPQGILRVHVQTIASTQDVSSLNVPGNTELNVYGKYELVDETEAEVFALLDSA